MIKKIAIGLCFLSAILLGNFSSAQEQETEFVTGIVQEISPAMIKVDTYYSDEENGKVFKISDTTIFENVTSAADIVIGDEVYLDFVTKDGESEAVNIYKMAADDNIGEEATVSPEEVDEGADEQSPEGY